VSDPHRVFCPRPRHEALRQAVEYARWWTAKALDLAHEPDTHPGLIGHLTAADVQHRAAEHLISLDGDHAGLRPAETRASEAQPPSKAAA
jgi:hypothetical protein